MLKKSKNYQTTDNRSSKLFNCTSVSSSSIFLKSILKDPMSIIKKNGLIQNRTVDNCMKCMYQCILYHSPLPLLRLRTRLMVYTPGCPENVESGETSLSWLYPWSQCKIKDQRYSAWNKGPCKPLQLTLSIKNTWPSIFGKLVTEDSCSCR